MKDGKIKFSKEIELIMKFIFPFLLFFVFISCSTTIKKENKVTRNYTRIKIQEIYYDSISYYKGSELLKERKYEFMSTWEGKSQRYYMYVYPYDQYQYYFPNRLGLDYYRDSTKGMTNEEDDKYDNQHLLFIIDNKNKTVEHVESFISDKDPTSLYKTEHFHCFHVQFSGHGEIYGDYDTVFVDGVVLFKNSNPKIFKILKYYPYRIEILEEIDGLFRIYIQEVKASYFLFDKIINFIASRVPIGSFYGTGKYKEFIYNQDLELVSEREFR